MVSSDRDYLTVRRGSETLARLTTAVLPLTYTSNFTQAVSHTSTAFISYSSAHLVLVTLSRESFPDLYGSLWFLFVSFILALCPTFFQKHHLAVSLLLSSEPASKFLRCRYWDLGLLCLPHPPRCSVIPMNFWIRHQFFKLQVNDTIKSMNFNIYLNVAKQKRQKYSVMQVLRVTSNFCLRYTHTHTHDYKVKRISHLLSLWYNRLCNIDSTMCKFTLDMSVMLLNSLTDPLQGTLFYSGLHKINNPRWPHFTP